MDLRRLTLLVGLLTCASSAEAAQSLSCRVQAGQVIGTAKVPRITQFVWSAAHGTDEATGPIRTSLGQVDQGTGPAPSTVLTLGGKRLALPASLSGSVRFGHVIDYGGKVALAYLVERAEDSSASPSQAVVLLGPGGVVLEADVLPGTAATPGEHCVVVQ
ncbi:hypothetical protein [Lysobacter enzymogenes]|uniref:hypothetical protein n=1 Tax=Lysobacter enzymogenes TaxID=69 RepID=UPI0008969AA3|nr:hypothetical protein [Lysobacter enzymogenes]SDW85729.1 hypothetical protein SAMN05421681_10332 [Lysobacter enzymogenes]